MLSLLKKVIPPMEALLKVIAHFKGNNFFESGVTESYRVRILRLLIFLLRLWVQKLMSVWSTLTLVADS